MQTTAPAPAKVPKELTTHGDTRVDNYYWMRDREDEKVMSHLKSENEYFEKMTAHTKDFQEKLYQEIIGRIPGNESSVPYRSNGYWYQTTYTEGKDYPVFCRAPEGSHGQPNLTEFQPFLDVNQLAEGQSFCRVSSLTISPDNKILAYAVDLKGRNIYMIHFRNLETGTDYPFALENTGGGCVWANDNRTLFYVFKNTETLRNERVMRYTFGEPVETANSVYFESDDTFSVHLGRTKSKQFILIHSYHNLSTEIRVLDSNDPTGEPKLFQSRNKDLVYDIDHMDDYFYIRTNLNHKNYAIMRTQLTQTAKENWEDVISGRDSVFLEDGFELFRDYLVILEYQAAIPHFRVISWDKSKDYRIPFSEDGRCLGFGTNREADTSKFRLTFESMRTPTTIYEFDMDTKDMKPLKREEVVGGHDPDDYISQRMFFPARDGAFVPLTIVYHKTTPINGTAPVLLKGYGAYGVSYDPDFQAPILSLLQRGFVHAIAHIRGGKDLGEAWYDNGRMLHKKNTFTDFIDAGEWLVSNGYSAPDKLFAFGRSAGGLLMGAITNMAPRLWRGVVAGVPFVDVVTTMLDDTIPLTTFEYGEWGNPNEKKYYDYMKSYSPYDNVEAKDYPAIFVFSGLHDSAVQYFEPAKWVAKLRELKTNDNSVLFSIDMDCGHGGASGRFSCYKDFSKWYTFLLDQAGKI